MVACQNDELFDSADTTEQIITFNSSVEATRASQTTNLNSEGNEFNVATFLTDSDNTHYYTDVVYYTGSAWTSGVTRYWPVDYKLDMFAYSPIEYFIEIDNATYYSDYSLTYTCPMDIYDQIDLLVKTLEDQSYTESGVDLEFEHALSSIKFNIEIESESNVTLNSISMNYIGIEKQRTYNFATQTWGDLEGIYFLAENGVSTTTTLTVDKDQTIETGASSVYFTDIDEYLIIIPQPVSSDYDDPHYITVQVLYTLNSTDTEGIEVKTGVMPLPAPNIASEYKQGESYTYNIIVNGETMTFGDITIVDQDDPVAAYGNIDLGLITERISAADIGYTGVEDTESLGYWYSTALRVKSLLLDGVRDFVVVGSMGADSSNPLGNGKLGYYGGTSSPFVIGPAIAGGDDYYFSVDLRGTYDHPEFQNANNDTETGVAAELTSSDIAATDPILTAGMFANVTGLNEVILPHGIMAIGNHAFDDCDALVTIDIADVKHIEIGGFQNASLLKTVTNGALTRIHNNGFGGCKSLTTIDLSAVTQVDDYGFVNCASLTDVDLSKLGVIGTHAFSGCSNLTLQGGTSIPAFEYVADYAFYGCYLLGENGSTINLEHATSVGDHAFSNCEHIQLSSEVLDDLETVGSYAFYGCDLLGYNQEFEIKNLVSIDTAGFANCPNVNIISGLSNLESIPPYVFQGCTSLTGYASTASGSEKVLSLPKVDTVAAYGFNNTAITNIAFSQEKLTDIERHAFSDCLSLTTITGLEGVTNIKLYAFSGCTALEELVLPSVTSFGDHFISSCTSLTKLEMDALETQISEVSISYDDNGAIESTTTDNIFTLANGCTSLKTLKLPLVTGEVPEWNFQSAALETVDLSSIETVGNGVFGGCSALNSIDLSSAESVGHYAFQDCSALEELILPEVTSFGVYFISGCSSLTKLEINALVDQESEVYTSSSGSTSTSNIFDLAKNCTALETLILPKVEGSFGGYAYFCTYDTDGNLTPNTSLKTVDLSSITELDEVVFLNCSNLEAVDLRSLKTISSGLFIGCKSLKKINLSSFESIANVYWAFEDAMLADCEIWLPESESDNVSGNIWTISSTSTDTGEDVTNTRGITWKDIHLVSSDGTVSDGIEFNLIEE